MSRSGGSRRPCGGLAAAALAAAALATAALATACLATPLGWEEADELGPESGRPSPRHRPGQPCLVCHNGGFPEPGAPEFSVAGTVYAAPTDTMGENDVEVVITDATGAEYRIHTNGAGNFMLQTDSGLDAPLEDAEGILYVPAPPVFPLHVAVRIGLDSQEMRTDIHREGSCNKCHTAEAGATSPGRVFTKP